jgi:predicted regulator of Ras-like GTPase activity (Roadblock/LC7/MglB family)
MSRTQMITDLIIRREDLEEFEHVLQELLQLSLAKTVLLVNRNDGSLITCRGLTEHLDTVSLAALAAGAFASAREIARLVGEPEFSVLSHQGEREHVHVNLVGEHGLLMVLFDDRTTMGLVRVCARQATVQLEDRLS